MTEQRGNGVVATVGVFDGVHEGHRYLFEQAAFYGSSLLAVTFNCHPLQVVCPERSPKWITPPEVRNALLSEDRFVDRVVQLNFDEQLRALKAEQFMAKLRSEYGVETLVMGYDHHLGCDRSNEPRHYEDAGARAGVRVIRANALMMECADGLLPVSSSRVRRAILSGDMTTASQLLDRDFSTAGTVVHGRSQGRLLGFPTANLLIDTQWLLPAPGVYAVLVFVDGRSYRAMANIGVNPTLTHGDKLTVEVHIFDYSGDIYGKELLLTYVQRIRDERRFDSVEQLIAQLHVDRQSVQDCLKDR